MICMSQNFSLFLVSNLSVLNFLFFSAHVSGVAIGCAIVGGRTFRGREGVELGPGSVVVLCGICGVMAVGFDDDSELVIITVGE